MESTSKQRYFSTLLSLQPRPCRNRHAQILEVFASQESLKLGHLNFAKACH